MTYWQRQKITKKTNWFDRVTNLLISYFSIFHVIFFISWCNKFIFFDVDCENVKNRTHTYWNRFNEFIKNFIETNSLIVVTNSLNVIDANKLLKITKRNETKIFRSCWKCNKFKNRKFCWWFWIIVCWFDMKLLLYIIFFYQTIFQRFKKMNIVKIIVI